MAISFVQGNSTATSAADNTPIPVAFLGNNSLGNLLILVFRLNAAATVVSVTDTQGNSWILGPSGNISTTSEVYEIWYVLNCKAGPNTVSITETGATAAALCIGEYSGVAISSALDGAASAAGLSSGNISTTVSGDLIVGYAGNNTGSAFTAGTGFTLREQQSNVVAFEDKISGAAGTYSATFIAGPSDTGVIAFKAAASAPVVSGSGWLNSHRDFVNKRGIYQ